MTATYTFDVFSSLDGFASYDESGDWGGYWGKQGPEFLDHRLAAYDGEQRMIFGATTFRSFLQMLPALAGDERDPWIDRMLACPTTVVSSTLQGPFDWPDATHTSPSRMSSSVTVLLPFTVSVNGPPAASAGR